MGSALVTVRDAAARLGVSEAAARRWIHRGRLRAVRVGRVLRIDPRDLDKIVERGSLDAANDTVSATTSRSALPWVLRAARRYLDEIEGDVEIAREALLIVARDVSTP
jgi:excisionase family DNA binding protein